MKIVSWNFWGLGGLEKKIKEVRELVGEKMPYVLCIQESKIQSCDDFVFIDLGV